MTRVGILGGSFNPPHVGHLICARLAAEQLDLDEVLLMPLAQPSHRTLESDPGPAARLELCQLAVQGDPVLVASNVEVERGGVSYMVETLESLAGVRPEAEFVLILGADAATRLEDWREPERILELSSLAIAPRGSQGDAGSAVEKVKEHFPDARVEPFEMPPIGISSSQLRSRIGAGLSVRDVVPEPVAERIAAEGWYRGGAGA